MLGASKLARVFLRSCALALLISYPFALLPPGAADQPYGVRVPTALILGLIALTVIVRCPFSLPPLDGLVSRCIWALRGCELRNVGRAMDGIHASAGASRDPAGGSDRLHWL